ncbi:PLDc N-terminal domain-containing protein [Candidatus Micrarchaeota archaeon]|nr:PLDc N-terminal domain-containing protein [Candidatus Micrarchaeota archaeon]
MYANEFLMSTSAAAGFTAIWAGIMGFFWLFYCLAILVCIVFFVIWVWLLIDCLKRENYDGPNDRLLWALVILFGGIIGCAIYYFLIKQKKDQVTKEDKS